MAYDTPNPMFSIILFIILTILYFVVKYIFISKNNSSTYLLIAFYCYLGINFISQLTINISLTNQICGESQWYNAFFISVIPWIIIFGTLNVLLKVFPGWLIPFSNTFGYGIVKLGGINKLFSDILVDQDKSKSKSLNKALQEIYSDQSLLINKIGMTNFNEFWSSLESAEMLKSDVTVTQKQKLLNFVNLKTIISEFIWFILVGLFTISTVYNYIINLACKNSVSSMKARHEKHDEDIELIDEADKSAPEKRIYATYE